MPLLWILQWHPILLKMVFTKKPKLLQWHKRTLCDKLPSSPWLPVLLHSSCPSAPRTQVSLLLLQVPSILFHFLGAFALAFLSIKTLFPTEIYLANSLTLWNVTFSMKVTLTTLLCSPAVACSVLFILLYLFFSHTINIIFYYIICMHAKSLQSMSDSFRPYGL